MNTLCAETVNTLTAIIVLQGLVIVFLVAVVASLAYWQRGTDEPNRSLPGLARLVGRAAPTKG